MKYLIVEYSQNKIGRMISNIVPHGLAPSFREGEPYYCSRKIDTLSEAQNKLQQRIDQLKMSGNISNVIVDIEVVYR